MPTAANDFSFGAQWVGQDAPQARTMSPADLVRTLADETPA